jgi:hypothetical protein
MSALVALLVSLVLREGGLAGVVDAPPPAGCAVLVPALGVGDVLAPGELLLGTVCEGVLDAPAAPGAVLPVCALARPNTANVAIDARETRTDFLVRMGFSPK